MTIRVGIVEDDPVVRQFLVDTVHTIADASVVATTGSCADATALLFAAA